MQTFLVGGAVRDTLLNQTPTEYDWVVVGATPDDLLQQGFKPVGKDFPVFIHPVTGDEYALARTERKSGTGYTGFVCHSTPEVTLEEDLLRRDLTINAIARAADGTLIDPYGGQRDLAQKSLRHVSNAFIEDPLRVLRTARFAARFAHLGFTIAEETLRLMQSMAHAGELQHLVAERIWKETERALQTAHPAIFFQTLATCDALSIIFPEFVDQFSHHIELLDRICKHINDPLLRFAYSVHILPELKLSQLADRLRLPSTYREACFTLSAMQNKLASNSALKGTELLELMEALDGLRRPQRLEWLCEILLALHTNHPLPAQLNTARQSMLSIKTDALVAQGLTGKAIGDALRQQRLMKLQELYP